MKISILLAIIVHYTAQLVLECCKICEHDMGPNTIMKIIKITKIFFDAFHQFQNSIRAMPGPQFLQHSKLNYAM